MNNLKTLSDDVLWIYFHQYRLILNSVYGNTDNYGFTNSQAYKVVQMKYNLIRKELIQRNLY